MSKRLNPYQRICRNAKVGRGVYLSARECFDMSLDSAIETVASIQDERDEGRCCCDSNEQCSNCEEDKCQK